jgi:2-haloacid dehalogenase
MTSRRAFIRSVLATGASMAPASRGLARAQGRATMPRVVVCDVNETLLDIAALEPHFKQAFGDGRVLQEWFTTVLLYSEVATLAGPYSDFASIGGAALDMTAAAHGVALSAAGRADILQGMLKLPAHPDVRDGLQIMRDAGLRLVTLTNSAPGAVQQQLANAGLASFFERSFSVDSVRRFKPAAEPYRSVADALGLPVDRLRLVAAHAWDVLGALRAGCAAAFVSRPGKVLYPLGPKPDIVGPDFRSVARRIVEVEAATTPR